MQRLSFERQALGLPINVTLSGCGNDTLVKITGGCSPHIGSVSVAYWDSGEPVLRTLLLPDGSLSAPPLPSEYQNHIPGLSFRPDGREILYHALCRRSHRYSDRLHVYSLGVSDGNIP